MSLCRKLQLVRLYWLIWKDISFGFCWWKSCWSIFREDFSHLAGEVYVICWSLGFLWEGHVVLKMSLCRYYGFLECIDWYGRIFVLGLVVRIVLEVFLEWIFLVLAGEGLCNCCLLGFLQNLLLQMCFPVLVMCRNVCKVIYVCLDHFSCNMFWGYVGWITIMVFFLLNCWGFYCMNVKRCC